MARRMTKQEVVTKQIESLEAWFSAEVLRNKNMVAEMKHKTGVTLNQMVIFIEQYFVPEYKRGTVAEYVHQETKKLQDIGRKFNVKNLPDHMQSSAIRLQSEGMTSRERAELTLRLNAICRILCM